MFRSACCSIPCTCCTGWRMTCCWRAYAAWRISWWIRDWLTSTSRMYRYNFLLVFSVLRISRLLLFLFVFSPFLPIPPSHACLPSYSPNAGFIYRVTRDWVCSTSVHVRESVPFSMSIHTAGVIFVFVFRSLLSKVRRFCYLFASCVYTILFSSSSCYQRT